MFKINLLSDSVQVSLDALHSDSGKSSQSFVFKLALGVTLLLSSVGLGVHFYKTPLDISSQDAPELVVASKNLKKPSPSSKNAKPVAAAAIEETVKDVPIVAQKVPQPSAPAYPSEDLYGQRIAINKMIKNILKISGENIGYSSVVLQAPNYYYMHGLSPTQDDYRKFKTSVKKYSVSHKVTKEQNRGITGKSKEFTVYGAFKLKRSARDKNLKLSFRTPLSNNLKSIKTMASKSGLNIKKVVEQAKSNTEGYTRAVVRVQFESTYKELFPFVKSLKNSKLAVGVLQLSLKSTKDEKMAGVFDLVIYSK